MSHCIVKPTDPAADPSTPGFKFVPDFIPELVSPLVFNPGRYLVPDLVPSFESSGTSSPNGVDKETFRLIAKGNAEQAKTTADFDSNLINTFPGTLGRGAVIP